MILRRLNGSKIKESENIWIMLDGYHSAHWKNESLWKKTGLHRVLTVEMAVPAKLGSRGRSQNRRTD